MQLYAGLPIITNQIPPADQDGVPHHLLGCIGLDEPTWVVGTFVRRALATIGEIRARGKLPVLVGGTHYYTQSLLFHDRLARVGEGEEDEGEQELGAFVPDMAEKWPILKESTEVLLGELGKVDPVMAERWHPNDRRKIQRSLEIFLQTGRKASDIYAEQRMRREGSDEEVLDRPDMRFSTLLFWVHAENEALRNRLDDRVDKMLEQGLLDEVETLDTFAREHASNGTPVDEGKGIWVSIGYKEFKDYIRSRAADTPDTPALTKQKTAAVEKTKASTRQYAKRQVRWIRIKLLNALAAAGASSNLYCLDGSDAAHFDAAVIRPAVELTQKFLDANEDLPPPASLSATAAELLRPRREDLAAAPECWAKRHCGVCDVTAVTPLQWAQHLASNGHRKRTGKARRAAHGESALSSLSSSPSPSSS
jgi:tRNA dimethylallyltransferase